MQLIPYEKLTLTTGYSPYEIKRRLEAGVGQPRGCGFKALRKPKKLFEGKIDGNQFLFWRAIRHSNGFMPLIKGRIEPGRLELELKWHPFTQIFVPVWMGIFTVIYTLCYFKNPNDQVLPAVFPLALVGIIYATAIVSYNFYANKAKAFLNEVVR